MQIGITYEEKKNKTYDICLFKIYNVFLEMNKANIFYRNIIQLRKLHNLIFIRNQTIHPGRLLYLEETLENKFSLDKVHYLLLCSVRSRKSIILHRITQA